MRIIDYVSCCKAALSLASASGLIFSIVAVSITIDASAAVPAKLKRECRSDYKTFCPAYQVGTSQMRSCMRSNGRQLSWGCYQALKDYGYVNGR